MPIHSPPTPLPSPCAIMERIDSTQTAVARKHTLQARTTIQNILDGKDTRFLVVVGPCSIHEPRSALEYGQKLRTLASALDDTLYIVMRTYFEKPRTNLGFKGFINDPNLDESFAIEQGLYQARTLLVALGEMGMPCASEVLSLHTAPYIQDLLAWTAIGARTNESQIHRELASSLDAPVGVKNSTNGDIKSAIHAMQTIHAKHHFININQDGNVAVVQSNGNQYANLVLRGGNGKPNYDEKSVRHAQNLLKNANLSAKIIIDASHENSGKDEMRQMAVVNEVARQIVAGNRDIVGIMLESHLHQGKQAVSSTMRYGVSITDACLGFDDTANLLHNLRNALHDVQCVT